MSKDSIHDENDVRDATASYQSEFPYEQGEEAQVTRREFCNFLGLTSAGFFLGSAGFAAKGCDACVLYLAPSKPANCAGSVVGSWHVKFSHT